MGSILGGVHNMSTPDCAQCVSINCDFPSDLELYSLDGLDFFLAGEYSFVLECPPGYYCPDFPVPWKIGPGVVPPVRYPTPTGGKQTIPLRIRCCENQYVTSQVIVTAQPGPASSGSVTGNVISSEDGVYGTVLIVGSPARALVQNTIRTVVQNIVGKLQAKCAELKAACDAERNKRIFPPGDPRNPIPTPIGGKVALGPLGTTQGCLSTKFQANIAAKTKFAPLQFSILAGSLPPGLTLTAIGPAAAKITGTPTVAGSYTFTIQAQDPIVTVAQRQYTICIISIAPATLPDATLGIAYSETFTATACATPPLSWQVVQGSLPPGLTLDEETGVLSGTPTVAGNYSFLILLQTEAT